MDTVIGLGLVLVPGGGDALTSRRMPRVTCSRCFVVFEARGAARAAAPLCPACAAEADPAPEPLRATPAEPSRRAAPRRRRRSLAAAAAAALAAVAAAGLAWLAVARRAPESPVPPAPGAAEARVQAWRAAELLPAGATGGRSAEVLVGAGTAALADDRPARTGEALRTFREAIAVAPGTAASAVAGYATALADSASEDLDGEELRGTHAMVREALQRHPGRPDLVAAFARLLLLVPSASNDSEALSSAERAAAAAPGDPSAQLALGLALLRLEPSRAARTLEEAARRAPADRRLLTHAARARWAAGDAAGAIADAEARLALDGDHPGALAVRAEVEAASDLIEAARATLGRWAAADPASPLPPLLLARIAYQRDGDLPAARRLLDEAMGRRPGDFATARILAHRAAVEMAAGDLSAAAAAVQEALRRIPASGPARFQAALLAFRRGDAAALRESAGILGDRGGALAVRLLAARRAELSGPDEEAQQAWTAAAALAPRDPAVLLAAAGALARLRAPGPALALARTALGRDPAEGRFRRPPTDYWGGPEPLADAARRLEEIGRAEPTAAAIAFAAAAECELLLGRTVPAERLAKAAAAASPQASAPLAILAQVALDRGRAQAALQLASTAVEDHPGDPVALAVRARALEGLRRGKDAERAHREAIEAGPDLRSPRLALGRMLARRGQAAEATALLEPLLQEDPDLAEARGALLGLGLPARSR